MAGYIAAGAMDGEFVDALGSTAINVGIMLAGGKALQIGGRYLVAFGRTFFEVVPSLSSLLIQRVLRLDRLEGSLLFAKHNRLPYDPRAMERLFAERYGVENVTSSTLPRIMEKNVALAGTRHRFQTALPAVVRGNICNHVFFPFS